MTRDETIAAIAVMQSWVDGRPCQYFSTVANEWRDLASCDVVGRVIPAWSWSEGKYRIKPEPRAIYVRYDSQDRIVGYGSADFAPLSRSTSIIRKFVEVIE